MRQRSLAIGHRTGIAHLDTAAVRFAWRLTEQNSALGVHNWPACLFGNGKPLFRDRPILERTPNVKADPCFCVCLYGPVVGTSPGWTPRDSAGAAGLFARRFALLPKTTGRRRGSPAMPAAESAKTEFCLSKGIPEPRAVAGIAAEKYVISRHCEPTGRANARPMTGSAKQSSALTGWIASSASLLAMTVSNYCETVCTTLPTGRVLATGSFISLTSASSYSAKVCSGALAFICTTL
jgi:hypothetical protein